MVAVCDLDGAREQLCGGIPDPDCTVSQNDAARRPIEAPPGSFSQNSLSELRTLFAGVPSGSALDGGGVGNRTWVPNGQTLLVASLGAPDGAQLHFPCFG